MEGITNHQANVLQFIKSFQEWNGRSPMIKEIIAGSDIIHESQVRAVVHSLITKGYVIKESRGVYAALPTEAEQRMDDKEALEHLADTLTSRSHLITERAGNNMAAFLRQIAGRM
ncbi:hypothetical protein [Paenibacillus sp. EPM92]|uniref:LexA family protein n=1 Tax=Paenibacillus sp. EPM92 TaxID=1561195 RepID=UPI001916B506|nr:hypothetical protein [Paenibacillus sp. EPM92]